MGKHAFPPLPTRPRLVLAVYPALFIYIIVISEVLELQHSETTQMLEFFKSSLKCSLIYLSFTSYEQTKMLEKDVPFFFGGGAWLKHFFRNQLSCHGTKKRRFVIGVFA